MSSGVSPITRTANTPQCPYGRPVLGRFLFFETNGTGRTGFRKYRDKLAHRFFAGGGVREIDMCSTVSYLPETCPTCPVRPNRGEGSHHLALETPGVAGRQPGSDWQFGVTHQQQELVWESNRQQWLSQAKGIGWRAFADAYSTKDVGRPLVRGDVYWPLFAAAATKEAFDVVAVDNHAQESASQGYRGNVRSRASSGATIPADCRSRGTRSRTKMRSDPIQRSRRIPAGFDWFPKNTGL